MITLDQTKNVRNIRQKEKKRTECINKAFSELRKCIPNVPPDTKLSKIKTLRLASAYIAYLSDIRESSEQGDSRRGEDFCADLKILKCRERRKTFRMVSLKRCLQTLQIFFFMLFKRSSVYVDVKDL